MLLDGQGTDSYDEIKINISISAFPQKLNGVFVTRRLMILRHSYAAPASLISSDHDRDLTPEGIALASVIGTTIDTKDLAPDLVIASDAARVQQTVSTVVDQLDKRPQTIMYESGLYNAPVERLLQTIQKLDDSLGSVLLVAHNPGIGTLVQYLAKPIQISGSYTEATLSIFDLRCPWDMITPHYAICESIINPVDIINPGRVGRLST